MRAGGNVRHLVHHGAAAGARAAGASWADIGEAIVTELGANRVRLSGVRGHRRERARQRRRARARVVRRPRRAEAHPALGGRQRPPADAGPHYQDEADPKAQQGAERSAALLRAAQYDAYVASLRQQADIEISQRNLEKR